MKNATTQNNSLDLVHTSHTKELPPMGKVAYIMSRFPKLTETFILYEMMALESHGISVEVFPLLRENQKTSHPEVDKYCEKAHFYPFLSLPVLAAHWHFIKRKPKTYFRLWVEVLAGTFGSANFFFGALGIFPKSVRFAYDMEKSGVRHVHAHFATHPAVSALIIHRLTGIPFSFTAHGSDLHVERKMLDKKVHAASFVATVSAYNKKLILSESGENCREKVHVVHCGVDPETFQPKPAPSDSATFHILCVASFEEVKGHKYLIEACKILSDHGIAFDCHLVGEGPLRKQVEQQINETGLSRKIHLHGGLPRPEVIEMLNQTDVFVLPSIPTSEGKREGIPVVLMEAMASGLPVLSSELSGIPELVDNNVSGILVSPRNSTALADALEKFYSDPDLRMRMGKSGRKKVTEEFNLQKNAIVLINLFKAQQTRHSPA